MNSLLPIRFSSRILCCSSISRGYINYASRSYIYKSNSNSLATLNFANCCHPYSSNSKLDSPKKSFEEGSVFQESNTVKVNQRSRLKQAFKDYGATLVIFHVAISLTSLGLCYLVISSGVDVVRVFTYLGFSDSVISSKLAAGGSTFVVAYAVHRLLVPVRVAITLSVVPFIVRYLRKINWLKPPKNKP